MILTGAGVSPTKRTRARALRRIDLRVATRDRPTSREGAPQGSQGKDPGARLRLAAGNGSRSHHRSQSDHRADPGTRARARGAYRGPGAGSGRCQARARDHRSAPQEGSCEGISSMAGRRRADSGGGVNRLGPAKVQRGRTAPSAKQMANEQEEAGFNPAFLLSSRPADFVRKPPSNRDTPDLATNRYSGVVNYPRLERAL